MRKYLREQGNKNNFRDKKAGNQFESNFGNKGTEAQLIGNMGTRVGGTRLSP